mgnify:FL=1
MVSQHWSNESSHTTIGLSAKVHTLQKPITIRFGNNGLKQTLDKGQFTFHLPKGGQFTLNDVYHVHGIIKNLLSISQGTSNETIIEFHHNQVVIHH